MTTNGSQQPQLSCRVNAHGAPCKGCGQLAVVTLEWFLNVAVHPASLALLGGSQSREPMAVGKEMFTLCLYCLRRERYSSAFDGPTPRWVSVETQDMPLPQEGAR